MTEEARRVSREFCAKPVMVSSCKPSWDYKTIMDLMIIWHMSKVSILKYLKGLQHWFPRRETGSTKQQSCVHHKLTRGRRELPALCELPQLAPHPPAHTARYSTEMQAAGEGTGGPTLRLWVFPQGKRIVAAAGRVEPGRI